MRVLLSVTAFAGVALLGVLPGIAVAELKDPVRRKIERYGLTRTINPRRFFPTIESAVAAFRGETGAEWAVAVPPPRNHSPSGDVIPSRRGEPGS